MRAYIAVGANLGDPRRQVERAVRRLAALGAARCSSLYRTEPLGSPDQPWYVNAVVELDAALSPIRLLRVLKRLERQAGRGPVREHWGPRILDLDLLLYGDRQLETPELSLPHPGLAARRFVLEPLAELAPGLRDPRSGRSVGDLLADLDDPLSVEKLCAQGTSSTRSGSARLGKEGPAMKIFLDTAHVPDIREATELGLCDGVTTNPSLLAREDGDPKEIVREIAKIVEGPISAEVVSLEAEGMVREGLEWVKIASNIVVKIPMCEEGLKAIRILSSQDIQTNTTLIFNPMQALLAAKAGASMVSPFVGRLDDIQQPGMELIEQIVQIFGNYGIATEVLVASIRGPLHAAQAAMLGADIATIQWADVQKMLKHPLTDSGIERFLADWEKVKER